MKKKDISAKTTVKAIITGFVSYGIIVGFICTVIVVLADTLLRNFNGTSARGLYITLPIIASILLYFIIHGICKLSTYDVFKTCKTHPSNYKKINKYLTLFFAMCTIFSIFVYLELLSLNLNYQVKTIQYTLLQYRELFSEPHIALLAQEMIDSFNFTKTNLVISTVILVIGISISMFSLIPYQRKLIIKYNDAEEPKK